ncbi:hypothetical protein COCNU_04G014070 [Cocos nucifera]|uniref:Uncharacterized protein n=1 Tax=Cocos nucifera TaxID=13894 RepID=A0A8K0I733_COCNU|nr:hypothetical protein COCNU_04G014070 [Cocos nucifera]
MEPHQPPKTNVSRILTLFIVCFTLLVSLVGFTCFLATYIPLSHHQVHGEEALFLYKTINWIGIVLMPLPFALVLILLLFLVFLRCTGQASDASPASTSESATDEAGNTLGSGSKMVSHAANQMSWDGIDPAPPDYDQMNELMLAFRLEKERALSEAEYDGMYRT